ncbi:MAG: hypothetical protein WAR57_12830 [Candidatus Phosphoribacter sp.]
MPTHRTDSPIDTLAAVVRLLSHAGDLAWRQAIDAPSTTLMAFSCAAQHTASLALQLLPADASVDTPLPADADPIALLHNAAELIAARPLEDYPTGTHAVIAGIGDLMNQVSP